MTTLIPKFDFKNGGSTPTGAVNRPINQKLAETVSAKDFGATGDGVTNDTVALQNAIDYIGTLDGGTLLIPAGTYIINAGLTITHPITIIGEGDGYPAWTTHTATIGTTIKYTGSSSGGPIMIKITDVNGGGIGVQNVKLDGNNLANEGLVLDGVTQGYFANLSIIDPYNVGIRLSGTTGTCSWNTFINTVVNCFGNKACIWLSGFAVGGNACHNTFINSRLAFGSATGIGHGIYLGGCDNNYFAMTFIFDNPSAIGYGVYVDPTEQNLFPINNVFDHLQASTKGWYQPSTTQNSPASIFGYSQDNGQPLPITNGTYLNVILTDRGNIKGSSGFSLGYSLGKNFVGEAIIPSGDSSITINFPYGSEPDTNYYVYLTPKFAVPPAYYAFNSTAAGFSIQLVSAAPADLFFNWMIIRI